jgi:hypothetical protein
MAVPFKCPCGRQLQARDEDTGAKVQCPVCRSVLLVPTPTPARPAAAGYGR